jgi:hypothetical protein
MVKTPVVIVSVSSNRLSIQPNADGVSGQGMACEYKRQPKKRGKVPRKEAAQNVSAPPSRTDAAAEPSPRATSSMPFSNLMPNDDFGPPGFPPLSGTMGLPVPMSGTGPLPRPSQIPQLEGAGTSTNFMWKNETLTRTRHS